MQTEFDGVQAQKEIDEAAREIVDAFCAEVEELAARRDALIRGFARSLCLQLQAYVQHQQLRALNGNGAMGSAGGLLGGASASQGGLGGSQIRGNGFSFLIIDEFATVPTDLITMKKIKRPNKGPQGDIEPWKRRGRRRK